MRDNVGEANELDFKREWPETSKLAKHVLGLANFGGGCMVIGVEQGKESALNPVGLSALAEKTEVLGGLNNFLPDTLRQQVAILDFPYEESEYPKLKGKYFQVLLVEDDPVHLPFVAIRAGAGVKANAIYTRRGAATEEATYDELQRIFNRRLETGYSSRRELDLRTHLEQLKILYEQLSPYNLQSRLTDVIAQTPIWQATFSKRVPNPSYPEEDYETFVALAIARKKKRIEAELDVQDIPATQTP